MNNLIRKRVILCLLDCVPKSAEDIASEIGESLTAIQDNLAQLASENFCEEMSVDAGKQWAIGEEIG